MKKLILLLFLSLPFTMIAQSCNSLGVWMWYLEITGFDSHAEVADSLSNLGVKRIYVKVADGSVNTDIWPELIDQALVQAYHDAGLEVWAWSYNYPGNNEAQAEALYMAAQTGYDGFVVDVEIQFDNKPVEAEDLFTAFYGAREQAIADQIIEEGFKIYCTTWGNPIDHLFPIDKIDPYVDGFMPQTYVEVWGQTYLDNLAFWIEEGNQEYAELGATKPIHHIAAMESGQMTGAQVNEFMMVSGAETSIWRIPGGGTPLSIWDQWNEIDWDFDFCATTSTSITETIEASIFPNPASSVINLTTSKPIDRIEIIRMDGSLHSRIKGTEKVIDVSSFPSGVYTIHLFSVGGSTQQKLVVSH